MFALSQIVACARPDFSEVGNFVLWVSTRIILIQVQEQEYLKWLVQEVLFCIGRYPLH